MHANVFSVIRVTFGVFLLPATDSSRDRETNHAKFITTICMSFYLILYFIHFVVLFIRNNDLEEVQCLIGATHYVSSVCSLQTNDSQETMIYVGSNDAIIYCYSLQSSEPVSQLKEHSGTGKNSFFQ